MRFEKPEMKIVKLDESEVIATSGGCTDGPTSCDMVECIVECQCDQETSG